MSASGLSSTGLSSSGEGATAALVEFLLSARLADMPANVVHEAKRSLINIVGCTIGGARHEAVETLWSGVGPFAGAAQATLIGRGAKTDALTACLVNTYASSINTFDDTHAEAIIHASGPVMAAVFAIEEMRPVSGAEALAAFALGVEIACRLSKAVSVPPAKVVFAWSQTGICSSVAVAAAAARLLGLDAARTRSALGIAATVTGGIRASHGTNCTALLPAHAAEAGLRAAFLAEKGFTGTERFFEARYGLAECFSAGAHLPHLTGGLGSHWEILSNTYKPFPCGIVVNPLIDAAMKIRAEHGITSDNVASVAVKAAPEALDLCDRPNPTNEMEAQVSLYHWVAAVFVHGRAGVPEGGPAAVHDPAMIAFRRRVTASADAAVPIDGCDMTVTLKDGRRIENRVRDCIGSRGNPMTDAQLEDKVRALAASAKLSDGKADQVIAACWGFDTLADGAAIAKLCG